MAAKKVTDPNRVPGEGDQANEFSSDMSGETLALLQDVQREDEADDKPLNVELPTNNQVQIGNGHPTKQTPRYNSKGKQVGWDTVLDKAAQFMQPGQVMRRTSHHATVKGGSGKVLVFADTGVLLARYQDRETAEKYLKAAGVDLLKLFKNCARLKGRDIRNTVPDKKIIEAAA